MSEERAFVAPFVLEYSYKRSLGPTLSRFMTSLRDGRIEGVVTRTGRVLVPPSEYDPQTGEDVADWVEVGPLGTVTTWTGPVGDAVGWALVRLDGADTAMLHRVDAPSHLLQAGLRVRPRWRSERVGSIDDIECFEPAAEGS